MCFFFFFGCIGAAPGHGHVSVVWVSDVRDMSVVYLHYLSTLAEEVKSHSASVLPKTCIELMCEPYLPTTSLGLVLCEPQVDESHSCADELRLSFSDLYAHLDAQRMAVPKGIHDRGHGGWWFETHFALSIQYSGSTASHQTSFM